MGNLIFMLNLNNIELISVNCVYPEDSVKALLYSSKESNTICNCSGELNVTI